MPPPMMTTPRHRLRHFAPAPRVKAVGESFNDSGLTQRDAALGGVLRGTAMSMSYSISTWSQTKPMGSTTTSRMPSAA